MIARKEMVTGKATDDTSEDEADEHKADKDEDANENDADKDMVQDESPKASAIQLDLSCTMANKKIPYRRTTTQQQSARSLDVTRHNAHAESAATLTPPQPPPRLQDLVVRLYRLGEEHARRYTGRLGS